MGNKGVGALASHQTLRLPGVSSIGLFLPPCRSGRDGAGGFRVPHPGWLLLVSCSGGAGVEALTTPISERSAGWHPWRTPIPPVLPLGRAWKSLLGASPCLCPPPEAGPLAPEWLLRKQRRELGLVQG